MNERLTQSADLPTRYQGAIRRFVRDFNECLDSSLGGDVSNPLTGHLDDITQLAMILVESARKYKKSRFSFGVDSRLHGGALTVGDVLVPEHILKVEKEPFFSYRVTGSAAKVAEIIFEAEDLGIGKDELEAYPIAR